MRTEEEEQHYTPSSSKLHWRRGKSGHIPARGAEGGAMDGRGKRRPLRQSHGELLHWRRQDSGGPETLSRRGNGNESGGA